MGKSIPSQVLKKKKRQSDDDDDGKRGFLPTGSTVLNLALSDKGKGGFCLGRVVNLIGDRSTGKTLLALSMMAEATMNPKFDDHRLILDEPEAALAFNLRRMFGRKLEDRLELPEPSDTVQSFQKNVTQALKGPCIYVLDSFDALTSDEEISQVETAIEDDKPLIKKGYGVEKPYVLNSILRTIVRNVRKTDSLVLIISQTRENINPMSFAKKRRSGGDSLFFYSTHEIWLAVEQKLKKMDMEIGSVVKAKITKNKVTGKLRLVKFPVYYDYGIDDLGSCVDFLLDVGKWKKSKQTIKASELDLEGTRDKVIKGIEENEYEKKLRKIVRNAWLEREKELELGRKPRYE